MSIELILTLCVNNFSSRQADTMLEAENFSAQEVKNMTVAAIRPGGGLSNTNADDFKSTDIADPPSEVKTETTTASDHYVEVHPQDPRPSSGSTNSPSDKTSTQFAPSPDANFENADELVGPQELPEDLLLRQRMKQECARKEARVLDTMSYAGSTLLIGGLGAGLASGGMFGKRALLGRTQSLLHSLVLFTESGEGRHFNLDDLQHKASAIPGKVGTHAVSILNTKLEKYQGKLDAAIGEIHQELQDLDARLQDKMQIDQGLAIGLGVLGGAAILSGSILLLKRRGQDHYFKQAGRCEPDGLRLQKHDAERNRIETHHLDRSVGASRKAKRKFSLAPHLWRNGAALHFTLKF